MSLRKLEVKTWPALSLSCPKVRPELLTNYFTPSSPGRLPLYAGEAFMRCARGHAPRFTPSTHIRSCLTHAGARRGAHKDQGKVLLKQKPQRQRIVYMY